MSRRGWRFYSPWACATIGLAVGGCNSGDGLPRQAISGSVTLNGQRLKKGVISFYPAKHMLDGSVVSGGSMVEDGRFWIPRANGLIPGKYNVAIHAGETNEEPKKAESEPGNAAFVPRELIPTKYNSETKLEVQINNHAVKEMKFALTSE